MTPTKQLMQAEQALAQAHLTLDLAVIDDLLHPDYQICQPDGTIQTKADVLADYQTGKRIWTFASVDQMSVWVCGANGRYRNMTYHSTEIPPLPQKH